MQRSTCALLLAIVCCFTACAGHAKKIIVYASSSIHADDTKKNISVGDGTTHHEEEMDFTGGDPVTLNITAPSGKSTLTAAEDGLYIANLKNDTVIGSYQRVGTDNGDARITQDALKQKLDSLQKLVLGQNVNEANRNFFIPPNKIVKITSDTKAKVFGPFTTIPGSFDAGSVPEIYKFYSIREIRDIIGKLVIMTGNQKSESPKTEK